jgi:hypothetical protein
MRSILVLSGMVALPFVFGCADGGPKLYVVRGTILDGGKPYLTGRDGLNITFAPVDQSGDVHAGEFNAEDGAYVINGRGFKGIPEGKYKVTMTRMTVNPSPAIDRFNDQFSAGKTPIEVEVIGPGPIDIDLAKYRSK